MLIWFCVGYIVCETYNMHSELWYAQNVKIFNFFCYSLSKQDFPVHKQRISPSGHRISTEITEISPVYIGISFFEFKFPLRSEIAKFGEISAEILFPATIGISPKNEMVNPDDKSGPGWIHPVLNHATHQLILVISANRVGSVEDVPVVACYLHWCPATCLGLRCSKSIPSSISCPHRASFISRALHFCFHPPLLFSALVQGAGGNSFSEPVETRQPMETNPLHSASCGLGWVLPIDRVSRTMYRVCMLHD